MRPRGIPRGKHARDHADESRHPHASMRPRGIPRGKRRFRRVIRRRLRTASMRPRGIPRGKHSTLGMNVVTPGGFNEAAGNTPRKTPPCSSAATTGCSRFNEAAGNTPRKTSGVVPFVDRVTIASMRPRGIPRGKRTARKPLCMKGLPWQSRAVSRRCVATAENTAASREFMGQKYSIIKDPRALRALPGGTTAPKRSIHGGEMRITR